MLVLRWYRPKPALVTRWVGLPSNTRISPDVPDATPLAAIIGPKGTPGAGSDTFTQSFSANSTWVVNHNLGRFPATVNVLSVGGIEVEASIQHISTNQLIVSFSAPFAGSVIVQ